MEVNKQAAPKAATKRRYYNNKKKKKEEKAVESIRMIPLGGLNEIGKNITVYECQGDMFIVDCGLSFPDSDMFGVDLVIPDFTYIIENKDKIKGIVITHGHEDHIGALPYLLKE
ncbi:MAG: MBL fold metallo-hydrolase, partial [Oscillospiraceae bacterium]